MTEEQLNGNLIKLELQGICQDCIYLDKIVPIIRKMLSEEYKTGLEQSRFDKNMLEREKQELKKKLDELQTLYNNMFKCHCNRVQVETLLSQQKEFINYLESESKELIRDAGYHQRICLEILEKYKEIIGSEVENNAK